MFTPHNMSYVTCHMLHVTCHVSRVICHMSHVIFILFYLFFDKLEKLIGGGSVINGANRSSYYRPILTLFADLHVMSIFSGLVPGGRSEMIRHETQRKSLLNHPFCSKVANSGFRLQISLLSDTIELLV